MIIAVLSSGAVWAAALLFGALLHFQAVATGVWGPAEAMPWGLLVFPPLASWVALEMIRTFSPRRLFDRRSASPGRLVAIGGLAGVLGLSISMLAIPFFQDALPDWALVSGASFGGMFVPAVSQARLRRGACAICGYDLRKLPRLGRCPECGKTDIL